MPWNGALVFTSDGVTPMPGSGSLSKVMSPKRMTSRIDVIAPSGSCWNWQLLVAWVSCAYWRVMIAEAGKSLALPPAPNPLGPTPFGVVAPGSDPGATLHATPAPPPELSSAIGRWYGM